jgi:hypothetical protein
MVAWDFCFAHDHFEIHALTGKKASGEVNHPAIPDSLHHGAGGRPVQVVVVGVS